MRFRSTQGFLVALGLLVIFCGGCAGLAKSHASSPGKQYQQTRSSTYVPLSRVARYLKIKKHDLVRLIKAGKIPVRKINGTWSMSREEVLTLKHKLTSARQAASRRHGASNGPQKAELDLNFEYFKGYFFDTEAVILSPLNWDVKDWSTALLIAGATGGLVAADEELKEEFQSMRTGTTNDLAKVGGNLGDARYTLPALGVFYLYGNLIESSALKRTTLLGLESVFTVALFTETLKFASGRDRPSNDNVSGEWGGIKFSSSNDSFPSGHTSHAFALATIIANEYGENPLVPPIAYGLAALTGWSRLNDNRHWASDVFFGAALGYFTSKAIYKLHDRYDLQFSLYPILDRDQPGIALAFKF